MNEPIDTLIKEIAVKHGVALGRDDPVLILHTMNETLLRESADKQEALFKGLKEELELQAKRWNEETKARAERVLNAALSATKDAMVGVVDSMGKASMEAVQGEEGRLADIMDGSSREARRTAFINIAASCLSMLSGMLVLFAAFV